MTSPAFIMLNDSDNVATALTNVQPDQTANVANANGERVTMTPRAEIRLGHKVAMRPIALGELVVKHGHPIGRATADIETGAHVHIHNVISLSRETDVAHVEKGA